jgi:hypothetical protein
MSNAWFSGTYYRPILDGQQNAFGRLFGAVNKLAGKAGAYNPMKKKTKAYDKNKLNSMDKDPEAEARRQEEEAANEEEEGDQEEEKGKDPTQGVDKSDDSSILAAIFKIVPIGINVLSKGPIVAKGFKEVALSIIDLVKNLGILTVILFIDTVVFVGQFFYFIFTLLLCMVFNLSNIHKCILFYIFDLFLLAIFMIIMSLLLLIDVFFGIKKFVGVSCVESFMMVLGSLVDIDSAMYDATGVHIFSYPEFILNMCYRCEMMGDTSGFFNALKTLGTDLGIKVPKGIGEPVGDFTGGVGDIVSLFSL